MGISGLESLSVSELFGAHGRVMAELMTRGVVRSTNNPISDYAEYLCKRALSLTIAPKSTKGFDARSANGKRYEIKARRMTSHNSFRELSALRGLDRREFDYLVGILFKEDFSVWKACRIPHATVLKVAKYATRTNAWRFNLRDNVWSRPEVTDLTRQIQAAERESHKYSG